MKIMTFVFGTLLASAVVALFGWSLGSSWGIVALMVGATLVVGQVLYLVMLLGMAYASSPHHFSSGRPLKRGQKETSNAGDMARMDDNTDINRSSGPGS